jgi:uncharacterized membrane protein
MIGNYLGVNMPYAGLSFWGFLITLAIIVIVFVGPIWVIFQWVKYYSHKNNSALGIVKERYAKGELTDAEFMKIKKNIS